MQFLPQERLWWVRPIHMTVVVYDQRESQHVSEEMDANKGQVKYVVDSVLRGYGDIVNDGVVRIFINCANKDETEVSKLMSVFRGMLYIVKNSQKQMKS